MASLDEKLADLFRDFFDDEAIELRDETVADDIEDWDSLNHVKLVVAIEQGFAVKFSNREIASWQNVGDMKRSIAENGGG
jgi:acyl carrier protein